MDPAVDASQSLLLTPATVLLHSTCAGAATSRASGMLSDTLPNFAMYCCSFIPCSRGYFQGKRDAERHMEEKLPTGAVLQCVWLSPLLHVLEQCCVLLLSLSAWICSTGGCKRCAPCLNPA